MQANAHSLSEKKNTKWREEFFASNRNSQDKLHPPPNSLSGDITDRINYDPQNKIILHRLPLRPIETTQCLRIYYPKQVERLKDSGSLDQYKEAPAMTL